VIHSTGKPLLLLASGIRDAIQLGPGLESGQSVCCLFVSVTDCDDKLQATLTLRLCV
jgi:hypothetical protein